MTGRAYPVMKKRGSFLEVSSKGRSVATKGCVVQSLPQSEREAGSVGFTITKRTFKRAVDRNRIRRRLREVVQQIKLQKTNLLAQDASYVLIGRHAALDRPFERLVADVTYGLHQLKKEAAT